MSAGQTCMKVRCNACGRRTQREWQDERGGFGRCGCGGSFVRLFKTRDLATDRIAKAQLREQGQA